MSIGGGGMGGEVRAVGGGGGAGEARGGRGRPVMRDAGIGGE